MQLIEGIPLPQPNFVTPVGTPTDNAESSPWDTVAKRIARLSLLFPIFNIMVAQPIIFACAMPCFLNSAWGQGPGEVHGPQPSSQETEIEALKARVKQLEQSVEDIKKKEPLPDESLSPGTQEEVPAIDRKHELVTEDAYADARLDNAPFDPALRGFFRFPGSHTLMRVGSYIRTDAIYDFSQLGNINQFRPESIPTPNFDTSNYNMNARASRISLETGQILAGTSCGLILSLTSLVQEIVPIFVCVTSTGS